MRNISRFLSDENKPTSAQKEVLLKDATEFITAFTKPLQIYFFGSILEARFDSASDIDVVAVYGSPEEADQARRTLYGSPRPANIQHPIEILCVGEDVFMAKSDVGGVYWMARHQGRAVL